MSTEPDRIYLHDPHGCFDEDTEAGDNNTVTWSEERIDENDYEYVRNPQKLSKSDAYSLLAEVRAELLKELLLVFKDLLDEAKCYYHLYPNSHRGTVEEYFEIEDKLIKKVSEHFS
jgi:hypothetical protein